MLAVARPVPGAKNKSSNLSQASASNMRIDGMQCLDPAGELQMLAAAGGRACKSTDRVDPGFQMIIARKVEPKGDRPGQSGSLDDVEPNDGTISVDQQMLMVAPAKRANSSERSIKGTCVIRPARTPPGSDHARVDSRRPHRQHGDTILRRIFWESAAPSPR